MSIKDIENVTIGRKKIKAYKIEFGLKGFIGFFAPTFYFWYSFDKPHIYLKYEGPDEAFELTEGMIGL